MILDKKVTTRVKLLDRGSIDVALELQNMAKVSKKIAYSNNIYSRCCDAWAYSKKRGDLGGRKGGTDSVGHEKTFDNYGSYRRDETDNIRAVTVVEMRIESKPSRGRAR